MRFSSSVDGVINLTREYRGVFRQENGFPVFRLGNAKVERLDRVSKKSTFLDMKNEKHLRPQL